MSRNPLLLILILSSILSWQLGFAQATFNKKGGIAFRVDDNQTAQKWRDFNRVFNKYGFHFSLGIDVERLTFDTASLNAIREISATGHELMDHTPYGSTAYLWVFKLPDTMAFFGHPAVHHINRNRICLRYDSIITGTLTGEGLVDLIGNKLISRSPGEFKDMYSPAYYSIIYLPAKNKLCAWYNLENKNPLDPDTLMLRTYWQETFENDTAYGIPHHRLSGYDVKMKDISLNLLINRSLYLFDSLDLPRPYTWIQPGGAFAQLNANEVKKKMGDIFGYTAGATYVNPSFKMYKEVDSLRIKRFALQNPDFSDESSYFQTMVNTISDNSARHLQSFTLGHFVNPVGGWDAYLARIDSLLKWCRDNDIPVRTINQWASIMFDSVPNPYVNVIPEIQTDLNKNGTPDGMAGPFGTFDSTDGVARSLNRCISRTTSGNYFAVNIMGGVEKGWNRFSVYTKGMPGDSIQLSISLPEISGSNITYRLPASFTNWTEVSKLVYIDPRASRVTMQLNAIKNNNPGAIKISGAQLRKESQIRIDRLFQHKTVSFKAFANLPSSAFVYDSAYAGNQYKIRITVPAKQLTVVVDTINNILRFTKPSIFWTGKDSVKVFVQNNDGKSDSAFLVVISSPLVICAGDSIRLEPDTAFGRNFSWQGQPSGANIYVKPTTTTTYTVNYTNKLSQPATANLQVLVDAVKPIITLAPDTTLCQGRPFTLTVPNSGTLTWYDETGNKIKDGPSISQPPLTMNKKLIVSNRINTCIVWDTIQLKFGPLKKLGYTQITDSTTKNLQRVVTLPGATGLNATKLNTTPNQFLWSNGDVVFNPMIDFTGRDSALFRIYDGKCSNDTVWVRINVKFPTGMQMANSNSMLRIYPNPFRDYIRVEQQENIFRHATLFDMEGKMVESIQLNKTVTELTLKSLERGIYLLYLQGEENVLPYRLVKE